MAVLFEFWPIDFLLGLFHADPLGILPAAIDQLIFRRPISESAFDSPDAALISLNRAGIHFKMIRLIIRIEPNVGH